MSNTLKEYSDALQELVNKTGTSVVAVKAAPYRVVSGVVLQNNLIAVSNQSLRREDRVPVHAADGSHTNATILGRDSSLDLAILKAENLNVRPLATADPASLKAGMLAAVVGMTVDVGLSASLGILGAVGGSRRTWRGGTLDQFIRLDASLYPSQSGAAVVTAEGNLIGMATAGLSRHSVLVLPPPTVHRIAQELLQEGRIRQGYIGVGVQPVTIPQALQAKLAKPQDLGLMLLSVEPESPAEQAGFQLGDILLSLEDKAVTGSDELQTLLRGSGVGKSLPVLVLRSGDPVKLVVIIGERARPA